jgi:HlyD family secretion protein
MVKEKMRSLIKWFIILSVLIGIGVAGYTPAMKYWRDRTKIQYRTQKVARGDIILVVNSTGEVKPVQKVSIGSVVSGPVQKLYVDFNDPVKKDQILAEIDPKLYDSAVLRDRAILKTREAEVQRAQARLQQAINAEKRAADLKAINSEFISDTELDELIFTKAAQQAELTVAETNVEQARANLENSLTNMGYTKILAPVDGIIIDRKVDQGQTLAAQFQTPELFVIAPELDKIVNIFASVDEADIGLIRRAQAEGQTVRFTVDAYPNEIFESGKIKQVRFASTTEQNVVTYPVVVETPNERLKLLPGMTANLSFQIEKKTNVIKIPNAALRFYPERTQVHPDDRTILDGVSEERSDDNVASNQSASEKFTANQKRTERYVWYQDGDFLRAIKVHIGISDSRFTELLDQTLEVDKELVIGEKPKET